MAVEYTNRVGATYRLLAGKTKTGKPRYFFSSNPDSKGEVVDEIPDGFEIYERPENAQVFLRKKRPQFITDLEKHVVKKHIDKLKREHNYLVNCEGDYITIYESNVNVGNLKNIFDEFLRDSSLSAGSDVDKAMKGVERIVDREYSGVMRFQLVDQKRRRFVAERFCYRGSIDDWIHIGGPGRLEKLVKRYTKFLGTDDFYELF
jgi:hypothetical protein